MDRLSVYDKVTASIVHQLEQGIAPWAKPWGKLGGSPSLPINAKSGRCYSGVNVLMLWGTALDSGFQSNAWLTFKQAQDLGGMVRKGSKGTMIVYADRFVPAKEKARAERDGDEAHAVPFLKSSYVFALEQIDGLPLDIMPDVEPLPQHVQHDGALTVINGSGVAVRHGGDRAFYSPSSDFVQMPVPQSFKDFKDGMTLDYVRTCMHELVHSTGHGSRLARQFGKRFGDSAYAREELVAELGSAFLCAALGIEPTLRHADYLGSWLKVLKADNKAIFSAASAASKASDWLLSRAVAVREAA
ncbi:MULTISPECIES: ArdC family protein [Sphingomonas]|uniref:ArdC family protein n=1 Tax=Sphingomonas TaxID=13687 RepID=UPI000DEFF0E6|nr:MULTISPECIES: zincin-like metallopeptidase domain-containing protein [Sphingomonas]